MAGVLRRMLLLLLLLLGVGAYPLVSHEIFDLHSLLGIDVEQTAEELLGRRTDVAPRLVAEVESTRRVAYALDDLLLARYVIGGIGVRQAVSTAAAERHAPAQHCV